VTAPNAKHTITDEGSEFLNDLCEAWGEERSELQELVKEHGLQLFTGGGGTRAIVPFPDKYITEFYFDDWEHETSIYLFIQNRWWNWNG